MPTKLSPDFYLDDTVSVARNLLGCILWRRVRRTTLAARIVETEAYLGANDPASHARRGLRSDRNESMYLSGGHAYVYFTYGMHWCMNVVTQEADTAEAVLLRAVEPIKGIEVMRKNRPKAKRDFDLTNGPGKICMAMEIDRKLDGERLDGESLYITARDIEVSDDDIVVTPRVGIDGSGEAAAWPLRFLLRGNRYVSAYRNVR
ncbi:MAG TPA: DNA-3-methyladenine glycosylase [Thermoanaerobaculia bacterium]|nr:DNA-3-methyladenine glycosylase [Thermoanaerobaculia bacterium]